MCGRYTFRSHPNLVAEEFELPLLPPGVPRWNISPTQMAPVLRMTDGKPDVAMLRWGLIPSWVEDTKKFPLLINAQSETIAAKPAFRAAYKRRRCLVLADGYYEWKKVGKQKLPWHHRLVNDRPLAFAGLWERWEKAEKPMESFTILTTAANELAREFHDRMPVILNREARHLWLDPEVDPAAFSELLRPYPAAEMTTVAVCTYVNKAGNEGPECLAPAEPL